MSVFLPVFESLISEGVASGLLFSDSILNDEFDSTESEV